MRINKYIASATGVSRRAADALIQAGRVTINGKTAGNGDDVSESDTVTLDQKQLDLPAKHTTILLNKPVGYVCSRDGQGSKTIYDLLPTSYHNLKPIGRLDKDSSGLLLLTNDGELANRLTHPKYQKEKTYHVSLARPLNPITEEKLKNGVMLSDGLSRFSSYKKTGQYSYTVVLNEGRNRQIRRTFEELGSRVTALHREQLGTYTLGSLKPGAYQKTTDEIN